MSPKHLHRSLCVAIAKATVRHFHKTPPFAQFQTGAIDKCATSPQTPPSVTARLVPWLRVLQFTMTAALTHISQNIQSGSQTGPLRECATVLQYIYLKHLQWSLSMLLWLKQPRLPKTTPEATFRLDPWLRVLHVPNTPLTSSLTVHCCHS